MFMCNIQGEISNSAVSFSSSELFSMFETVFVVLLQLYCLDQLHCSSIYIF